MWLNIFVADGIEVIYRFLLYLINVLENISQIISIIQVYKDT